MHYNVHHILLVLSLFLLGGSVHAQHVIGSIGHSVVLSESDIHVEMTVGESVIVTGNSAELLVTQGFHQPSGMIVISGIEQSIAGIQIEAMPNPVTRQLSIHSSGTDILRFEAFDLQGKLMTSGDLLGPETRIDMQAFPGGLYTIVVRKGDLSEQAVFQIVKQ